MKFYVYCLAEILSTPPTLSGISGARVELINVDDFHLLVSDYDSESPPPVTREHALAHDAVVRSVLNETTPLPFRFGTVQTEPQLRSYIISHKTALEAKLAQVRGCVEMSVKIISHTDQSEGKASVDAEGPGSRFLKEKQREMLGGEERAKEARNVSAWLAEQVAEYVREQEISLCPTEKLIVSAAHLVARAEVAKYRDRLASARNLRPELHFLVSGPWPPYTFSNIELEFKSRFGVS